jgi:Protein of unknown function (DUF3592)
MIFADFPVHWADPATWPWVVWVWIAIVLAGQAMPIWRWFRRRQAQDWPTVTGRIDSVRVKPKGQFLSFNGATKRAPAYTAVLEYTYSLEGNSYLGIYQRDFTSEEESREFVRDLQGKTVIVSRNPGNPAKSLLAEDSVSALLASRPPAPEGMFKVKVPALPRWVKPLLWPFVFLSAAGLGLSLWVNLGAVGGKRVAPEAFFWILHCGIFIVWFPAIMVAKSRVGSTRRKDFWKLVLKGSPEWMVSLRQGCVS